MLTLLPGPLAGAAGGLFFRGACEHEFLNPLLGMDSVGKISEDIPEAVGHLVDDLSKLFLIRSLHHGRFSAQLFPDGGFGCQEPAQKASARAKQRRAHVHVEGYEDPDELFLRDVLLQPLDPPDGTLGESCPLFELVLSEACLKSPL